METTSSVASESVRQCQTMKKRRSQDAFEQGKSGSPSPSPTPVLVANNDLKGHNSLPVKQEEPESVDSAVELTAVAVPPSGDVSPSKSVNAPPTKVAQIAMSEPPQWQKVIEASVKAVVSIRFSQVAAFDTEGNQEGVITNGIFFFLMWILTRHPVHHPKWVYLLLRPGDDASVRLCCRCREGNHLDQQVFNPNVAVAQYCQTTTFSSNVALRTNQWSLTPVFVFFSDGAFRNVT